ncbi:MAG TPA: alpha-ketoglutarate-dependent dioxygenase AlkB [Ilumatobacteraceae bacterium]
MTTDLSADLTWQTNLFGAEEPAFDQSFEALTRIWLDDSSWIDHAAQWLTGADTMFAALAGSLPWRQREVTMWDRLLPEPRLTAWWDGRDGTSEALPVLAEIRAALTAHYSRPFDSIGYNLYRDGRDSVAWHGDRERYVHEDPIVAIVSLGSPRPFQLRPRGGGRSITRRLGSGDLLVMGGACQHDWEHAVPKVAHASGPRLSIMFRHNLAAHIENRALRDRVRPPSR